jgi:SAM-dependent methyltransferase
VRSNEAEIARWNNSYYLTVWPRRERLTSAVTPYLLDHLELDGTERVLEVGPGGGAATFPIAARLPGGGVVGVDVSVPLTELARRRAREANARNATFVVADIQEEAVPGGPFDVVCSQFGVMFFDEPVKAFAGMRALARPGGRLVFACWAGLDANRWFTGPALLPFLPPAPTPAPGKSQTGPFSLADAGITWSILESAGWSGVERHAYEVGVEFARENVLDDDELALRGVRPDDIEAARRAVGERLAPLRVGDDRYRATLVFQVFAAVNTA